MGDLNSAIANINLQMKFIKVMESEDEQTVSGLWKAVSEKVVFLYYLKSQTYYDCKYYLDALETFNKIAKLNSNNVSYIYRRYLRLRDIWTRPFEMF